MNSPEQLSWHTEQRQISSLIPHKRNPRKLTDEQRKHLENSIKKFNLAEIPAINTDNTILAGHQRLKVMCILGRGDETIDVRVPNRTLTPEEVDEYCVRSNLNTGEWDYELLSVFNEDLLKDVGFSNDELDKIFALKLNSADPDEIPETRATDIIVGDMFQLGEHRLLCGDSSMEENIAKLTANEKMKLCFTSPPYNMASNMYKNYDDNLKSAEFINFNLGVINTIKPFLSGFLFWNISYNKNARWEFLEILYRIAKETEMQFLELIVWDKGHGMPITAQTGLTRQYEDILLVGNEEEIKKDLEMFCVASNDKKAYFNKKTNKGITNYWRIDTSNTQKNIHKACFPVALPEKGITLMTQRGDAVIDPFGGLGTTLIACEKLNRRCFTIELDPVYCQLIIDRWEEYTGKKAERIENETNS